MSTLCQHTDVREFDGLRSCLACGETRFTTGHKDSIHNGEYFYTDLRSLEHAQVIRVVVPAPDDYEQPLYCTIVLCELQSPGYESISYTWATEDCDATKSKPVHVDGSLILVTETCDAALRRLR